MYVSTRGGLPNVILRFSGPPVRHRWPAERGNAPRRADPSVRPLEESDMGGVQVSETDNSRDPNARVGVLQGLNARALC